MHNTLYSNYSNNDLGTIISDFSPWFITSRNFFMYNLYFYYYNLGVPDVNFYFQKNHFLDVFFKYFFTIQVLRVWSYNGLPIPTLLF